MVEQDTIFAAATPDAPASRAVVRISGFRAHGAVSAILGASLSSQRVMRGSLRTELGAVPAVCFSASAPASATGEDTAEIHVPGSRFVVAAVLRALAHVGGLRLAQPGEFSRRAFVNGKLSLGQAEAVMALIEASGETEARRASAMLDGGFARKLSSLCEDLEALCARMELSFDFDEEAAEQVDESRFRSVAEALLSRFRHLIASPRASGSDARVVVLVGVANAGKSALFNRIVQSKRAAVSDQQGTTRDAVKARTVLGGCPIELVDTAGFKQPDGRIEAVSLERTSTELNRADLILYLSPADGTEGTEAAELEELLGGVPRDRVIRVRSKSDLVLGGAIALQVEPVTISCSATTGEGVLALEQAIVAALSRGGSFEGPWVSERMKGHFVEAEDSLSAATHALADGAPLEVASGLARSALSAIREALGRGASTDVLDYAFSNFCVGK